MAGKGRSWYYDPPRSSKPKVTAEAKERIKSMCDEYVETVLKPGYIVSDPSPKDRFHFEDISVKWWRHYVYFAAKYHYTEPDVIAEYTENKFARLEYAGNNRFNLSYMRHTGKWWELFQDLSLEECFETMGQMPHFNP